MFHKILFACIIFILVGVGVTFHHFSETTDLMKKYQKLGLIQSDFQYEKVEKTWGEQGLIFYQVQFPFIDVPMKSDTMTLSLSDSAMSFKFKNIRIGITEGLRKLYGSQIMDNLKSYTPYQDFLSRLLTSLAVMGIDEFIGDMTINTVYNDVKTMQFTVQMEQESSTTLEMKGVIHLPIIGAHQISDLWNGPVDSAEIKITESWLNRYITYAESRHINIPDFVKQGVLKIKEKAYLSPVKDILK